MSIKKKVKKVIKTFNGNGFKSFFEILQEIDSSFYIMKKNKTSFWYTNESIIVYQTELGTNEYIGILEEIKN